MAKKPGKSGKGGKSGWLLLAACLGMACLLPAVAFRLSLLLTPGLLALVLDKRAGKPIARTMLLFGLAASIEPVRASWPVLRHGLAAMDEPDRLTVAFAWAAAATGWLLTQISPVIVRGLMEAQRRAREGVLHHQREAIAHVWGLDEQPPAEPRSH